MLKKIGLTVAALMTILLISAPAPAASPIDVQATIEAQDELSVLYVELQSLRYDKNFQENGFSNGCKPGAEWRGKVESFRGMALKRTEIAPEVRTAGGALLSLAKQWRLHGGDMTSMAVWNMQAVEAALAWTPDRWMK